MSRSSSADIAAQLEEDGIELLLPIIPDYFSSDDEKEAPKPVQEVKEELYDGNEEALRQSFTESYKLMATVKIHNSSERNLASERAWFDKMKIQNACSAASAIEYVDASSITSDEFFNRYVTNGGRPVMIRGILEDENYRARERWSDINTMVKHYGHVPLKITEIPSMTGMGRPFPVRLPLALYAKYSEENTADDPFYMFDNDFFGSRESLLKDFKVPKFFREDMYEKNHMTREFYPNYRHMIIGGQRTGTNMHVDPKCTSAWNLLASGHKKWAIFPPNEHPEFIASLKIKEYGKLPPAAWWKDVGEKLTENGNNPAIKGMIECVQKPGETIFVPAGWWHCVLNLDFTIAVTQNLLMKESLPAVWPTMVSGWSSFATYLEEVMPDLVQPVAASVKTEKIQESVASKMY